MQKHWPIKPIATILVVSISFSIVVSLLSSFFVASSTMGAISQWQRTYGSENKTRIGYSLIETSDGECAIAGTTSEDGDGGTDFWLAKTNGTGYMEWDQTYGGPKGETAYSLVVTSDGGYALAGNTLSFGAGEWDFSLVKTDEFGNMEWSQTYGGPDMEWLNSFIATSDGGYALVGETYSFGDSHLLFIKTDEYGNVQEPEQEPQP
jgi:hypothetical protein